jgi:tetratricopeptide (TPR) repeat protein
MSASRFASIPGNNVSFQLCGRVFLTCLLLMGLCRSVSAQSPLIVTPQTADEHFQRATEYLNKKDYQKAIEAYTEALKLNPRHAKAYFNRALAQFNLKNYDKAIEDATQAININPQYAEAYHNRGTAYASQARYTEALADIDQAIKLNPQLAEAYFSRGVINQALGKIDVAITEYTRAITLDPKLFKAYFNRGAAYYKNKDYDKALHDFDQAILLNPEEAAAYWARGSVYADKKEYDKAIADLSKAISLAPTDTKFYFKRAEVYCAQGRKELATADENKIIALGESVLDRCEGGREPRPELSNAISVARFEDYPAMQRFKGKAAPPILSNRRARQYRTMIQLDAKAGPNFAGAYTIAAWGCGSTCMAFAIIDARTGRIYFHQQVLQVMQVPYQAENVLQFRPESRLLIISGEILPLDPDQPGRPESIGKFYYEWKNDKLKLLGKGDQDLSQLNSICAGIDNSYQCAQAIERHQLQKSEYSPTVNRAGSSLRLQLRGGRSVSLRDFQKRGDEASVVKYSFRDYLRDLGYFLIHRQFYEGVDYLMIQDRTGRRYEMQDLPVISPDKRRLVTASNGIGGGYGANAIEVWRLAGRSMIREQTITPEDWGPSDAEWIDNQTIRVVKNLSGADEARKRHVIFRFRRRWQMEPSPQ